MHAVSIPCVDYCIFLNTEQMEINPSYMFGKSIQTLIHFLKEVKRELFEDKHFALIFLFGSNN